MKKKILVVYPDMEVGGSTTSLLGFLSVIDYSRYYVDILLYQNQGPQLNELPSEINLLEQAGKGLSKKLNRIFRLVHPIYILKRIFGRYIASRSKFKLAESQLMAYEEAKHSKRINERYDIAISYLEGWPSIYVSKYVCAARKIGWVHVDYETAGFNPDYDRKMYSAFDAIVTVSDVCKTNMANTYPEYKDKIFKIGNISNVESIKSKSQEKIDFQIDENCINLISVCRLSIRHKGLDRMLSYLKKNREMNGPKIKWYIVGDGYDRKKLITMIHDLDLSDEVILLGEQSNPFPYIRKTDAFVLLSRYEGKPMAITEAQVLGTPVIVAEYASALEQIEPGKSGYILPNNDDTIVNELMKVVNKSALHNMKAALQEKDFCFEKEREAITAVLFGDQL